MKKQTCTGGDKIPLPAIGRGPAFPKSGNQVIRGLKAAMDRAECPGCGGLTQKRFAELVGMAPTTINDWYNGQLVGPIKAFLCGLERLGEQQRTALLRQICRDCARLQDPRLAHDVQGVGVLSELVREPSGVTFITGPSDKARTFLVTAMANSAGGKIRACGLDAHRPDTFVPVCGVFYLRRSCSAVEVQALLRGVWPLLAAAEAQLLILNGIWSRVPEIRTKIPELAKRHNVLIADDFGNAVPRFRDWAGTNASLIRVQGMDEQGGRLCVRILGHARKLIPQIPNK
jgi:hypothetical protein